MISKFDKINSRKSRLDYLEDKYDTRKSDIKDLLLEAIDLAHLNEIDKKNLAKSLKISIDEIKEDTYKNDYREIMCLRYHNLANTIAYEIARSNSINKDYIIASAICALLVRLDHMIAKKQLDTTYILKKSITSACIRECRLIDNRDSSNNKRLVTMSTSEDNDSSSMLDYFSFRNEMTYSNKYNTYKKREKKDKDDDQE